jgi:hypothetical protein
MAIGLAAILMGAHRGFVKTGGLAMTDANVGPISAEETCVREAADQAYGVLEGKEAAAPSAGDRLLKLVSNATREAPLPALAIAFILGAMFARRQR